MQIQSNNKNKVFLVIAFILLLPATILTAYLLVAQNIPTKKVINGYEYYQYGIGKDGPLNTEGYYFNFLLRSPKVILDDFYSKGNKICVESIAAYYVRGGKGNIKYASGYTDVSDDFTEAKDIHVIRNSKYYSQDETMLHELGHFVDIQMGVISDSDEWKKITEEESPYSLYGEIKNQTGDGYYYREPKEFWAQEFCFFCNALHGDNEGGLKEKEKCPKAFEFIEKVLKEYYGENSLTVFASDGSM